MPGNLVTVARSLFDGTEPVIELDDKRIPLTAIDVVANGKKGRPRAHARQLAETLRTSVHAVEEHLVVGALLAAVVVLLFLASARSTVITAIAIPASIIGAYAVMYLFGFTQKMLPLLALAPAVGIDDAIRVVEIHRLTSPRACPWVG